LVAGNIKSGVKIFNVTGSLKGLGSNGKVGCADFKFNASYDGNWQFNVTQNFTVPGVVIMIEWGNDLASLNDLVEYSHPAWFPGLGCYLALSPNGTPYFYAQSNMDKFNISDYDKETRNSRAAATINSDRKTGTIRHDGIDERYSRIFYVE